MDPGQHDVVDYYDSMSCLLAIEGEDTENSHMPYHEPPLGTELCWMPSHSGIDGNEIVDQLANEKLDHGIDPLTTVHHADLKLVMNSYAQQEVQSSGMCLDMVETNTKTIQEIPAPDKSCGGCNNQASNWSRGPPNYCEYCGHILATEHMLLEWTVLQLMRDE